MTETKPFLAPAIVAALVWLALCLYLLLVVVGTLFNLDFYFSKPDAMQRATPPLERWFIQFQLFHGNFWTALAGFVGCLLAGVHRSARLANLMILLGIALLAAVLWATLPHVRG